MKAKRHPFFVTVLISALTGACSTGEQRAALFIEHSRELFSEHRFGLAEVEIRNALRIQPDSATAHYMLALISEEQQQRRQMFESLQKTVELAPDNTDARVKLARLYFLGGALAEAAQHVEAALRNAPRNVDALVINSAVAQARGNLHEATELAEHALAADPGDVGAIGLVAGFSARENPARALEILADGIGKNPDNLPLRGLRITLLERGLLADLSNTRLGLLLGDAYRQAGRFEAAIDLYESMLSVHPGDDLVANNLAALSADHRQQPASLERALEVARRFEGSSNPMFLDTLGWVHYRLGHFRQAVTQLERAVELDGSVPDYRYHLGMAYVRAGRTAAARAQLDLVLNTTRAFHGIEQAHATLAALTEDN